MAGATVAIIGGGGFIGQKLAQSLAKRGTLRDHPIEKLILADLAAPTAPEAPFAIHTLAMDISDADAVARAIPDATDIVFHLAAIVSG
ncbi:MAG: NAD-dependent epimerase/dehydratase family protein, partial [Pseudomonadota bacterium]